MAVAELVKVTRDYGNGNSVELLTGRKATRDFVDEIEPLFFKTPHGKRECTVWHGPGFVVSSTDIFCCNRPKRRRVVYLLVFSENDNCWMTWTLGTVDSVVQGKRIIDRALETGILRE